MRFAPRRYCWSLLAVALPIFSLLAYYTYYQRLANHWQQDLGLHWESANAAKHTYAAGQLYGLLRSAEIGQETSETLVLLLGETSERLENFVRPARTRDTNAETLKDLYNNQLGILAAEKHMGIDASFQEYTLKLVKSDVAISSENKARKRFISATAMIDNPPSPRQCIAWFKAHRAALRQEINDALETGAAGGN